MTPGIAYLFGGFRYEENGGLSRDGVVVSLAPRVHSLLLVLLRAGGLPVSKAELIAACTKGGSNADTSLARAVYLLRQALRDRDQKIVKTEYGRGLRIGVPVQQVAPARSAPNDGPIQIAGAFPHSATGEEMIRTAFELASSRSEHGFRLAGAVLTNALKRFPTLALAPSLHADIEVARMIRGYVRPSTHAKQAFALTDKALEIAPGLPAALATRGWLVGVILDDRGGGLRLIDEALSTAPSAWIASFYKTWLLIGERQLDAAADTLDYALTISPLERALLSLKGWLLCATGNLDEASSFVAGAVAMRPDVDLLWMTQAIIRMRLGKAEEARQSIGQALAIAPHDTLIQANSAWLNGLSGRPADAQNFLIRQAKSPASYVLPVMLAMVRRSLSDDVSAANLLKIADTDKDPWRLLAWCDPRLVGF